VTAKNGKTEPYGEVISRLKEIVESLERGELPLEESLERFAEGVKLVKNGEGLLAAAEKKIEQLLQDDRVVPLEVKEGGAAPAPAAAPAQARPQQERAQLPRREAPPAQAQDDDDVPF
jgi:exodeoxyribonuclease VII small subunit